MDSIGGISYYLNKIYVSCYKNVVVDNIICLSATELMHAPVHGVHNTVQQLLHKTHFISHERWHQQAKAELDYKI